MFGSVLSKGTDARVPRCRDAEKKGRGRGRREGGDKDKDREKMQPSAVTPKSQQDVWCAVHPPLHPARGPKKRPGSGPKKSGTLDAGLKTQILTLNS